MSTMADTKTKRRRRSYTDEFKASAVQLVLDEGRTVAGAARDLVVVEGFRSSEQVVFPVRDYGAWRPLVMNPERNRGLRLITEVTDDLKISSARDRGTRVEMRRSVVPPG